MKTLRFENGRDHVIKNRKQFVLEDRILKYMAKSKFVTADEFEAHFKMTDDTRPEFVDACVRLAKKGFISIGYDLSDELCISISRNFILGNHL